jgi:hypothetical protein
LRSKNRNARGKKDPAVKATNMESFGNYSVTAKGLGRLSIFTASEKAAEQVARRILGSGVKPYEGLLFVEKKKQ